MKIHTIIITYNGVKWIEKNIRALIESSIKTDIIIIDNGSEDGTQKIVKSYKEVQFIQSEKNLGFGKANNLGIKLALKQGADYLFLLNQDAWVNKNTISELIKTSKIENNFGIISPIHLNGSGSGLDILFSHCIAPSIHNLNHFYFSDLIVDKVKDYYQVPFINAAAWLLHKDTIERVGLFDDLFYHYGEDENYCQRLKFHGLKIVFNTKSIIFHDREDRKIKINNSTQEKQKRYLIELANINKTNKFFNKRIKYLKKIYLIQILKNLLKIRSFKNEFVLIKFLKKNKSKIIQSRFKNSV